MKIISVIKEMRPHHYIKNILVFAPAVFGGKLFSGGHLLNGFLTFGAFCLMSSAVYIINDLRDTERDRLDEKRRHRPIAAGEISKRQAAVIAFLLVLGSVMLCLFSSGRLLVTACALSYLALNLGYSFGLKDLPIIDTVILAGGFIIRMAAGSCATGIVISDWLYLVVLSMSFFLGLGKRRGEVRSRPPEAQRQVLGKYPNSFLENNMYVFMALTIVFYALWAIDEKTAELYGAGRTALTVPLVAVILMKYSLSVEGESDGDPVEVLLKDKLLVGLIIVYGLVMIGLIYFN